MTEWSAYVEYDAADVPEEVYEHLFEQLIPHGGTPSTAPNGNMSMYFTIDAPTAEHAITAAVRTAGHAVGTVYGQCTLAGVEVMTAAERDRRNAAPVAVPELAGTAEMAAILGITKARASQISSTARFRQHVQPVAELANGPVFLAAQLHAFAELPRPAGRPRKNPAPPQ